MGIRSCSKVAAVNERQGRNDLLQQRFKAQDLCLQLKQNLALTYVRSPLSVSRLGLTTAIFHYIYSPSRGTKISTTVDYFVPLSPFVGCKYFRMY